MRTEYDLVNLRVLLYVLAGVAVIESAASLPITPGEVKVIKQVIKMKE